MPIRRLHVVLAMETSLLTSAIQQCLTGNHRLEVEVRPPGGHATGPVEPGGADGVRMVEIGLLEDPFRFALQADGREWILEYRGLNVLADELVALQRADAADIR